MTYIVGSVILGLSSLAATWLLGKKHRWAWLVMGLERLLCIPYDVITRQYGFIILDAMTVVIAWQSWASWGRDSEATERMKERCAACGQGH